MTLLSRLFLLVAVALLPAIAIQSHNEFDFRRSRQVEAHRQALSLAQRAAAEQQRIVDGVHQVLIALSELSANDRFVGGTMPSDQYLLASYPGTTAARDLDGVDRIVGYSRRPNDAGGIFVTAGLDKAQAFSDIQKGGVCHGVSLSLLGASLVLMLTRLSARRFSHRPLAQLVDTANQWRLGDYTRRAQVIDEHSEVAAVAEALNSMADALAERERELYKAKEKAEQASARITTIFESTTDCVLIVDPNWSVTYLNQRTRERFCGGRDIVGMKIGDALPELVDSDIFTWLGETISSQNCASFERFCAGQNVWYEISASPSCEGLVLFLRDITGHRDAVEARRLIEEQLHQSKKMEAIGRLTGGVAHDFNNLLLVISGNLEFIGDCAGDNDQIRGPVVAASKATDRGMSLIAQLLAFSRRQKLSPRQVYANAFFRDFQGLIHRAIGEGYVIEFISDDQLWPCYVDKAQLETALLNLVLNGRDAMPDGGELEIEAQNVILDENAIAGAVPGSYVRLSVKDIGCGMAPEIVDRVFEPFFTTKEVGKGTGLGLSMVYGFVQQSGGAVTIESALGVGTTVSLYLPRSTEVAIPETAAEQPKNAPRGTGRVLVVDDDEDVLSVTSVMLAELGYQVVSARNGVDAIQLLKSGKEFDLLFSDVVMPQGITGLELAREAKRNCSGIKVLLTSGNAECVLMRYGATDEFPVIGKPFRRAELARRLALLMQER
ncbi:ATP-binding protein [Bradyrhizobium sp. Tv2a-2]|uniref:ATP-binding protein n=1 Tax=Bradyrhizobium sp. Tv2a-2 TaxID=113395 RepID=UPI000464EB77|nr:ATP-binding protein [Bradyrhizobium sp. Tv2a-2]